MTNHNGRLCGGRLFIIIIVFGLLSTEANAASFDCKKATTWLEKTVCANLELSKLDEQLDKAYHDALTSLSPEGQAETKQYQRQWLKQLPIRCQSDGCLKDFYKNRIGRLQHILIKFGDRIFRYVESDDSKTDKACGKNPYVIKELGYYQIENPRNENEKFWNTIISQKAHNELKIDDRCTDTEAGANVSFSNKHVISASIGRSIYAHEAAHPANINYFFCWLLEAKRELRTSDLFNDNLPWPAKLVALARQKLKEVEIAANETFEIEPSSLARIVTSADRWMILKDGLEINFQEYELGSRYAPSITIDWKTLDPYLNNKGHSLIYD